MSKKGYKSITGPHQDSSMSIYMLVRSVETGNYLTQSELSSINVIVTQEDGTTTLSSSITISELFDVLQTGGGVKGSWNFKHVLPPTSFPLPGPYTIDYLFTTNDGNKSRVGILCEVRDSAVVN